jgi:predicted PurR-regulated permease PerM
MSPVRFLMVNGYRHKDLKGWATLLFAAVSLLIIYPLLSTVVWSVTLAIATFPLFRTIRRWTGMPNAAAAGAVLIVAGVLVVPVVLISVEIGKETAENAAYISSGIRTLAERIAPVIPPAVLPQVENAADTLIGKLPALVEWVFGSGLSLIVRLPLCVILLFFCYRDGVRLAGALRLMLPLEPRYTQALFETCRAATEAIYYGRLATAVVQGVLGGVMFWILGVPGPLLWGAVMTMTSVLPVVGSAIIWVPVSAVLIAQGQWVSGLVLLAWGALVIGSVDNLLFPVLIGSRLQMHTAVLLIGIVGAVAIFGPVGIVLGPIILALTARMLELQAPGQAQE